MSSIKIKNGKLQLGQEKISLISGEFHYWRIDPLYWDRILDSIQELGLTLIASYISWEFHQIGPSEFDFEGKTNPRRNLKAFLDLTQQRGFKVFIRPGPYIYSEWKNLGLPDEAAKHHRLSSEFLKLARPYIKAVSAVIKPYLATEGGHIVLYQPDNEIDLMTGGFETELGLNGQKGPYQDFLKKKYQKVETLNKHWGSDYSSFDSIPAVTTWHGKDDGLWRRYYDYRDFSHAYTQEKAVWMLDAYKEEGIDVPSVLNTYSDFEVQNWRDLESLADVVGVDVYPENEFLAGPDSHQVFMERFRVLASYSKAPYIVEFECGLWHGFIQRVKNPSASHYELSALTAFAAGVVGWNWYMLVNRDNWYQAPITELGDFRTDLTPTFKKLIEMYHKLDPAENEKCSQTSVTFSYTHYRMGKSHSVDPLLKSLYQADIDYEFCDLSHSKKPHSLLLYSGEEWLPEAEQDFLLEHVESGGTLVCFKNYPLYDEFRRPCNKLNLPLPEAVLGGKEIMSHLKHVAVQWKKGLETEVKSEVYLYPEVDGSEPIWAKQVPSSAWELQWHQVNGAEYRIGLVFKRGKGRLILLGVDPTPELVFDLHQFCSVPIPSYSTAPHVQTALFKRRESSGEFFLVVTHNYTERSEASLFLPGFNKIEELQSFSDFKVTFEEIKNAKGVQIHLSLPPKSGDILRFKTNR